MNDLSRTRPELIKEISVLKKRIKELEQFKQKHTQAEERLRESEKKYQNFFESSVEGIFQATGRGRFSNANPAAARMLGYESPEELINSMTDLGSQLYVNPEDHGKTLELLLEYGFVKNFEVKCHHKNGNIIWGVLNMHLVRDDQGNILYIEGTCQDITERKQAELLLKESEERYRILVEHSNDGVALVEGDQHKYVNRKFLDIFGYDKPEDIIGKSPFITVHPDDREMVLEYNRKRQVGEPVPLKYEFKGIKKDGTTLFIEASSARIMYSGKPFSLACLRDITERKRMEEQLNTMSLTDELTGLYNRRGFITLSEQQLKIAERTKKDMLLFFVDLDRMKQINDTMGHQEGDKALIEIATILKEVFRESDIIGRIGGDEFAILAIDITDETQEILTMRLHNYLDDYNRPEGRNYQLSLSIGIAHYNPETPCPLGKLMTQADTLMYEEKRNKQR